MSFAAKGTGSAAARHVLAAALVLLALFPSGYLALRFSDMPQVGIRHDDGIYWICARSLALGQGYRIGSLPAQPYQTKYPPLYAWLISWVWRMQPSFPANLPFATLLAWLALPAFLAVSRRALSQLGLRYWHAWVVTALLALSPDVIGHSLVLMPELTFAALLLGALLLAESAGKPNSRPWLAALAGLLGGAAYLTKTAALPLLLTAPACLWFRKRRAPAVLFFAAMVPAVLGWSFWVKAHLAPASDSISLYYTDYLGFYAANFSWRDLPRLAGSNLKGIFLGIGGLSLFGVPEIPGQQALCAILSIGTLVGLVRLARRGGMAQYYWYAAGYILTLLVWYLMPTDRFERLLLPLFPLLLAGLSVEFLRAAGGLRRSLASLQTRRAALGVVCFTGLGLLVLFVAVTNLAILWAYPNFLAGQRTQLEANLRYYRWISWHVAPQDSVLVLPAMRDPVLFLYSGRRSAMFAAPPRLTFRNDHAAILRWYASIGEFARTTNLRYIGSTDPVFHSRAEETPMGEISREVAAALDRDPRWLLVYHADGIRLYRFSE